MQGRCGVLLCVWEGQAGLIISCRKIPPLILRKVRGNASENSPFFERAGVLMRFV